MIDFSEVERSVEQLKQQSHAGEIERQDLRNHLIDLIDVAQDGCYWMVGYRTGLWYRHDGKQWLVDNPDRLFEALPRNSHARPFFEGLSPSPVHSSQNHASSAIEEKPVDWIWLLIGIVILSLLIAVVYISI